jgi:hypothetical protein
MSIKNFYPFHAEQDAIPASKLLPDEAELDRILRREKVEQQNEIPQTLEDEE